MNPKIIFENDEFLAVNKPAGMLVHDIKVSKNIKKVKEREATLVDWLLVKYPELKKVGDDPISRPGIVHRLDKDTSGVILIPKNQEYFLYLKGLFQEHKIKKTYLAVVSGVPKDKEGIISKPIGIKDGTIKRSVHSKKFVKTAITNYRLLKTIDFSGIAIDSKISTASLLEVMPETGRTHQIRIHLSSIGHPILGDKLYGNKHSIALSKELNINHQLLHAQIIEFEQELSNKITIEAELPEEFMAFITPP